MRWRASGLSLAGAALLVAGVALLLPPAPSTAPATLASAPVGTAVEPLANGPCGGPHVAASFSGTLGVQGGSSPPSVTNRTVRVLYAYQLVYTPNGGSTSTSCSTGSATGTTDSSGRFALSLGIPASSCTLSGCSNYTGPFGPTSFGVEGAIPPGYFVTQSVAGTTVTLNFVLALGSASLTPFGRTTVSLLAPVTLTGGGLAGNGAMSPANLTFAWQVSGTGWTVTGGEGTGALTVVSGLGAGSASVTLYVNGTFNGTSESAAPASALLTPVATGIVAASVAPTSLDAGAPATFTIVGGGSAGYPYTATVYPGLGAAPVSAGCTTTPASGGQVSVTCRVLVAYPAAGTAQPSANLTNGWSEAVWNFPAITVAPAPALTVAPAPAQGYVGIPLHLVLAVAPGSGTPPYGPACLWPGDGTHACDPAGGTSWAFSATFGRPGTYLGTATLVDGAGTNLSVGVVTFVVQSPALAPFSGNPSSVEAGTPVDFATSLTGGALPAEYWWNASAPGTTLAHGSLTADGAIAYAYTPSEAGPVTVSLTVVDALGTVERVSATLTVLPGPAVAVASAAAQSSWSTVAGTPYPVSWVIVDPAGEAVPTAGEAVSLLPSAGAGPIWINRSGGVPVTPGGDGSFNFTSSDWRGGYLNFTLDAGTSAALPFRVSSVLPVRDAPNGSVLLTVTPDTLHLHLSDPRSEVVDASNTTLWRIADRFENPLTSGYIVVQTEFGGDVAQAESPVLRNGTVSFVWVNFSVPAGASGRVVVLSAWGQMLLPALSFAPPAAASSVDLAALVALAGVAVVCLAFGVRSRRPSRPVASTAAASGPSSPDPEEAALRRLAEGRAYVLYRADPDEPRELAELVRGFPGLPPTPGEVAEWVGSLVSEGALRATVGPDGKPRFARVPEGTATPPATVPRIEVDPRALEEALRRRPEPDGTDESADAPG